MAGAHFTAMKLLELTTNDRMDPSTLSRIVNAAARMMDVYQQACVVLQKLKTGGAQRVVVQYQQVIIDRGGHEPAAPSNRRSLRSMRDMDAAATTGTVAGLAKAGAPKK